VTSPRCSTTWGRFRIRRKTSCSSPARAADRIESFALRDITKFIAFAMGRNWIGTAAV
jgi:hypothetical protein